MLRDDVKGPPRRAPPPPSARRNRLEPGSSEMASWLLPTKERQRACRLVKIVCTLCASQLSRGSRHFTRYAAASGAAEARGSCIQTQLLRVSGACQAV